MQSYEYHPACLVLPKMDTEEFATLRESIRKGFDKQHPIILFDGKVLDGRHRLEACELENVTPQFLTKTDIDPYDYVRREHAARRSWKSQEQKALVIGKLIEASEEFRTALAKIQEEANKARQRASQEQHKQKSLSLNEVVIPQSEGRLVSQTKTNNDDVPYASPDLQDCESNEEREEQLANWHEAERERKQRIPEQKKGDRNKSNATKAAMIEVSRPAVERAATIKKKSPELAEKVAAGEMTASAALREIKKQEVVAALEDIGAKKAKEIVGVYDVIVIDPPWPMQKIERDVRPNQVEFDYPTMQEDELAAMKLPAAEPCHLWLWTTHKFLPMALRLLEVWGFKYVCTFVWHKPGGYQPIELPQYNCEFALYARKGTPSFIDTKAFPVCFEAPRGKHSEKPEVFYEVVRRVTAGRRVDMFNRRPIEGFDSWGNEAI